MSAARAGCIAILLRRRLYSLAFTQQTLELRVYLNSRRHSDVCCCGTVAFTGKLLAYYLEAFLRTVAGYYWRAFSADCRVERTVSTNVSVAQPVDCRRGMFVDICVVADGFLRLRFLGRASHLSLQDYRSVRTIPGAYVVLKTLDRIRIQMPCIPPSLHTLFGYDYCAPRKSVAYRIESFDIPGMVSIVPGIEISIYIYRKYTRVFAFNPPGIPVISR